MSHKILRGSNPPPPTPPPLPPPPPPPPPMGWYPRLASICIGTNSAAELYMRNQRRVCEDVGIEFDVRHYPADITQQEMLAALHAMNVDPRVTGIILQRPVPEHLDLKQLEMSIHSSKDVEGMSPANIGKVVYNDFHLDVKPAAELIENLLAKKN